MASDSSNSTNNYHLRSISLPSRKHPTILEIEEQLKKLKSWEETSSSSSSTTPTAEAICFGLSNLQELHKTVGDLLNLPLISQSLSLHQSEKWVGESLDKSVEVLDICGIAKDTVSQCKENVRDLQSSLRRRKGSDFTIEKSIVNYLSCRRQMKKDVKRSLASLNNSDSRMVDDLDHQMSTVTKILEEVNSIGISIFQGVLNFLSLQQNTNRWTTVARLMQKGRGGSSNELENIDAELVHLCKNNQSDMGQNHIVENRLRKLEGSLEGMENGLEVMFRCLIRSRTTLLNVFSC